MSSNPQTQIGSIGRLYSVLGGQPSPVLLIGAGASIKSGVPLASGIVERAARWAYARENGRSPYDPRLLRSDWFPWLTAQPWYAPQASVSENYAGAVEHLLQPRQARADFFHEILQTNIKPSAGYEKLAEFLHQGFTKTVLTTNFDSLLPDMRVQLRRPHHIDLIQTPSDYTKFSTSPQFPQLVYLHGSVDHYTDKNLLEEVQQLDPSLVSMALPLLRDHPLIVVGYRGAEPSIMRHLLLQNAAHTHNFRQGIFWCFLKHQEGLQLPPMVADLARAIGSNFTAIEIDGFDELFARDLWRLHQDAEAQPQVTATLTATPGSAPTLDMAPMEVGGLSDLDWATLRIRIIQYCNALQIYVPQDPERNWVIEQLYQANLATRDAENNPVLTMAGYLLFSEKPQDTLPCAQVTIKARGNADWLKRALGEKSGEGQTEIEGGFERTIIGNLWAQYDGINDVLAAFNRPFRLKGDSSETVLPYPPLALKEIVVNALVHRDYAAETPVIIEIDERSIGITNPGGLVDEVQRRVEVGSIEEEIRRGKRGIKGYRNPVLADLFYGSGEMDKAGSGLADVFKSVRANGGDVRFGPTQENSGFEAVIMSRPEAVDEITGTATPVVHTSTTYAANMLEFLQLPEVVYHAGTEARRLADVWDAVGKQWVPPFVLFEERVYSFHDLESEANPLHVITEGDCEALSIAEFADGADGERRLVWLLNQSLLKHFNKRGLIVDAKRKRAYFPRSDEGPRSITYQARLRRATRTVVKPRVSSHTGRVTYWEHESCRYRIEKFGSAWALLLDPGYVFTFDGAKGLLAPERVNRLSTRRAARDYNSAVHNDLSFWTWFISSGATTGFPLDLSYPIPRTDPEDLSEGEDDRWEVVREMEARRAQEVDDEGTVDAPLVILSARLPTTTVNDMSLAPGEIEPGDERVDDDELDKELEELAEEQREEAIMAQAEEADNVDQP